MQTTLDGFSSESLASPEQTDEAFQQILAENGLKDASFAEIIEEVNHSVHEDEPVVSAGVKTGLAYNSPNGRDMY